LSKHSALALPVEPVGGRHVDVRVAANRLFDHHEFVAVWVRQRPQQELIDDGEDSGVAADAEGQRQDHGERKARAAPEPASGVPGVSRDIFDQAHRPLVVAAFLEPRQIAELPPGGASGVDVAQPVASVVACERIDMKRHLALHVSIPRAPLEQGDDAANEARRSQGHVTPSVRARAAPA
jgi:hypothetical protein